MKTRNRFIVILTMLIVSLLLSACGQVELSVEGTPTSSPPPTDATEQAQLINWVAATATALRLTASASTSSPTPPLETTTLATPAETLAPPIIEVASVTPMVAASTSIPPATRTPVILPTTPAATQSPVPTAMGASTPQVIFFTVSPTTTHTTGEEVSLAWEAVGEKAEICTVGEAGPGTCQEVPLKGSLVRTDFNAMGGGLGLRVTVGQSITWSIVDLNFCNGQYEWFFNSPPSECATTAPLASYAVAQFFEHGVMVWVEATDIFYIFYYSAAWPPTFEQLNGPLLLKPGASVDNRIGETPPSGYFEPVSGFGLIWRDEVEGPVGVRQRLGWATSSEFGFDTTYQCETSGQGLWNCFLRGPQGLGSLLWLHPDSSAQGQLIWEHWKITRSPTPN